MFGVRVCCVSMQDWGGSGSVLPPKINIFPSLLPAGTQRFEVLKTSVFLRVLLISDCTYPWVQYEVGTK